MAADQRIRLLQQIPVFAVRQLVAELFPDDAGEATLAVRIQTALDRKPQRVRQALARMTRLELTRLVAACPEIDQPAVLAAFEEYRYGSHPSFYIFLFDPAHLDAARLPALDQRIGQALVDDNARFAADKLDGLPRIRDVALGDFNRLDLTPAESSADDEAVQVFEGTYRFLSRLDYVDADENPISTYETLYGFFWIGVRDGYVTIHARKPEVLRSLESAVQEAMDVALTPLVVSKNFKNSLRFLTRQAFSSSRLYEPNPGAGRFRWLTITDPRAYEKNYAAWENAYPEVRSANYRIQVGDRETTLGVGCDRGCLTLAGHFRASEFRTWAVDVLAEVIRVRNEFAATPLEYVETHRLRTAPALARFSAAQKDRVLALLAQVLSLARSGAGVHTLEDSAVTWALALPNHLIAHILLPEGLAGVADAAYLGCPLCGGPSFTLTRAGDVLALNCAQGGHRRWSQAVPFVHELEAGEHVVIDETMLRQSLELTPTDELLEVMGQLVNGRLTGYHFDPKEEGFYLRGSALYYYQGKDALPAIVSSDPSKQVRVFQISGDYVGGDKITVGDVAGAGIAIGRQAQASAGGAAGTPALADALSPVAAAIRQEGGDADAQAALLRQVDELAAELGRGPQADDARLAQLIDGLVKLAPAVSDPLLAVLASPVGAPAAGPITATVIEQLNRERVSHGR